MQRDGDVLEDATEGHAWFAFGSFELKLADRWIQISDDRDGTMPFTLAREDGTGALQFTVATYRSGTAPRVNLLSLRSLLEEFARQRNLTSGRDAIEREDHLLIVGATFDSESIGPLRAWYLSDGSSFALVTFVHDRETLADELEDCERMLRTLRWKQPS